MSKAKVLCFLRAAVISVSGKTCIHSFWKTSACKRYPTVSCSANVCTFLPSTVGDCTLLDVGHKQGQFVKKPGPICDQLVSKDMTLSTLEYLFWEKCRTNVLQQAHTAHTCPEGHSGKLKKHLSSNLSRLQKKSKQSKWEAQIEINVYVKHLTFSTGSEVTLWLFGGRNNLSIHPLLT